MRVFLLLLFIFQLLTISFSANILFFFGLATYSHRITAWPLVHELVERGHNVTFLSIYPNKNPNPKVIEIIPQISREEFDLPDFVTIRHQGGRIAAKLANLVYPWVGTELCRLILKDPDIIEWADSASFDLVVLDYMYNDCGLGFVHKFKAKHMVFGTSALAGHWPEAFGISAETHWIPDPLISFEMPLAFFERVVGTLTPLFFHYGKRLYMYPRLEEMLRNRLDIEDMPSLDEIDRNTSLILMNSHFSEELARSLPPYIIPVGGMHCQESNQPLPQNIAKIIDAAGDKGFVYISFGSALKMSTAPQELRDAFFGALRKINMPFLWKWDGTRPENMPPNVHTEEWMPQQDILAHPKIRAFITHGGLLGTQEALYHGVPTVVFPIFAEQDYNADRIVRTGRGISVDIAHMTQETIENAMNNILNDSGFKESTREISRRFKDRPMKPVDTAVWWTEYILRHSDTTHMRPVESSNMLWFQRHLLDVWIFIFSMLLLLIIMFAVMMKNVYTLICMSKRTVTKRKKTTSKIKKN